jgi:hypothetical protein
MMTTRNTRPSDGHNKMSTTAEAAHAKEIERQERESLNSLVRKQVIQTLGDPGDLLSVQVRPLWGTNYRVNVLVGTNITCATISHSFFLMTDEGGNILESTPKIKRQAGKS